jgi:iron complex outermembrane receptor protein
VDVSLKRPPLVLLQCLLMPSLLVALQGAPQDVTEMSIEDLLQINVRSVTNRDQQLRVVPAAVTVVRGEDLRRTGATTLPQALRGVPGLHVAAANSSSWIVAPRGFSDLFANKLLVLVDGRSIYTPLFSGVFWNAATSFMDDIDRIEVIRGPGATVWGANAVNGVVNIITKHGKDTQGIFLEGGGGTIEQGFANLRAGGSLGDGTFYRAHAAYFSRDGFTGGADDWNGGETGFRVDRKSGDDEFMLSGRWYSNETNDRGTVVRFPPAAELTYDAPSFYMGGHLQGEWRRPFGQDSEFMGRAYWTHTDFESPYADEIRDTWDLYLQGRTTWGDHEFTLGAGYRWTRNKMQNTQSVTLDPDRRSDGLASMFVQDAWTLLDGVQLTLGSKFEYNGYTGFEVQPGIRLGVSIDDRNFLWASAARAVRTPSQIEDDVLVNQRVIPPSLLVPVPTVVAVSGDRDFKSEELLAYELGYRTQPHDSLSLDLALFYNVYDNLRSTELGSLDTSTLGSGYVTQNLRFGNLLEGVVYGVEVSGTWQAADWLRLNAAYSFMRMNLRKDSDSTDGALGGRGTEGNLEGGSPRNSAYLRASLDPVKDVDIDLMGRWVGRLPAADVDGYFELDARVAWKFHPNAEVALVGQNLLHRSHPEAGPSPLGNASAEVRRGVYLSLTLRF